MTAPDTATNDRDTADAKTTAGLWALIDLAQERAQLSEAHNFESHAMAYERLVRLSMDLRAPRPAVVAGAASTMTDS